MKHLCLLIVSILLTALICPVMTQAASDDSGSVKELNFVFLHGMNGNSSAMQLLQDCVEDKLPAYITNYEYANPDISVETDTLNRSYENDADIETWAENIADSINNRFKDKKNIILVGHSMGGKTALYTVANNIGGIADKVAMVVTINSPVKSLVNSYYVGGDTALDYWGAQMLISGGGVLESLVNYDSSEDGNWVGTNKHWLAFVSGESSPLSSQFDVGGIDALPRDLDDKIVPISFQYADGADVVYYGEYGHSDFTESEDLSNFMADKILTYIFGGNIEYSVFSRGGSFVHEAGLLPGTDYWEDVVGGVLADSGTVFHKNDSFFLWKEWEDTVGNNATGSTRGSYLLTQETSFPIFTGVAESDWANADDTDDGRLYLKTRAAPRSMVQVDWSVYQVGLLASGIERDHYEIEIETGTPFSLVSQVGWETTDSRDVRLKINSQAQSPFRWFKAIWRVYFKESRVRQVIDELPLCTSSD